MADHRALHEPGLRQVVMTPQSIRMPVSRLGAVTPGDRGAIG